MTTNPPSNRNLRLAFGSAILTLLVVGVLSYRSLLVARESGLSVRHTQKVLENLDDLLNSMQGVESNSRGFVLSGAEAYLDPFRASVSHTEHEITVVRALTSDNPGQQHRIATIEGLAIFKIQHCERNIFLRQTRGLKVAADSVRDGTGLQTMITFGEAIHQMESEESQLLLLRTAEAQRHLKQTKIVLVLGTILGLLITCAAGWSVEHDQSRRTLAEEALFIEKERAQVTLNSIGDAVICTDVSGKITFINLTAERMTGSLWREAAGRPVAEILRILDGGTRAPIPDPMELAILHNGTMSLPLDCILISRDGIETPIEDSVSRIHNRDGQVTGAVIVFHDVTASRAVTLQIKHTAEHDFLTGLPNRILLSDRINQAIVLAGRRGKKVGILFLDLDGFKHINDSLGHPIGDKLLQSVAGRLGDCVRSSDTVSRQGGDEFVVLLAEMEQPEDAAITARRILAAVSGAHSIDPHDLHVTTSIGVSVYPDDGLDAETLIKNADTAMYQAKENGRQSYKFFKPAMNIRAVERQSMEESLRRALDRQEFSLHYQPKINLKTGKISGAEALLRWTHPIRGSVAPADFISVAEDSGLIVPIGKWVLREACRQARAWADAGLPAGTMAVNVSAMQFRDEYFLEGVSSILKETGLDPKYLELELTETALITRPEFTASILKTLKAIGVRVAVDDFGTGYSSLSYLSRLPIDALKIDQSFVHQITTASGETAIVAAIISMAQNLNLRVIAEGVETIEDLAFLQAHKCDEAQGYYFSVPVASQQFATLLESGISAATLHHFRIESS